MTKSIIKIDAKSRVSVGRYTELEPGHYFRIEKGENGVLTLTPVVDLNSGTEEAA